jgi:hypothetical protein
MGLSLPEELCGPCVDSQVLRPSLHLALLVLKELASGGALDIQWHPDSLILLQLLTHGLLGLLWSDCQLGAGVLHGHFPVLPSISADRDTF